MGWPDLERAIASACAAGLPALMLRDKTLDDTQLEPVARRLRELTRSTGTLLLVNRRLELARRVDADGVHLGAVGPTPAEARELLGDNILIGYSAHNIDEAHDAFAAGAHYVSYSPIFETPSKQGILDSVGIDGLRACVAKIAGPVLALGGIDASNTAAVIKTGAHGIAAIRAILGAPDPAHATTQLLRIIQSSHST